MVKEGKSTTIYNIETAPWNKFAPEHRFFSLPAAALFFFAAQHYLATCAAGNRFILSYPTDDGVVFYEKKLHLELRWSKGSERYALVERSSLERSLSAYKKGLAQLQQTLPQYRAD